MGICRTINAARECMASTGCDDIVDTLAGNTQALILAVHRPRIRLWTLRKVPLDGAN